MGFNLFMLYGEFRHHEIPVYFKYSLLLPGMTAVTALYTIGEVTCYALC